MAKVYYTDQGWCCVVGKAVSYYKDFCQAMDAAYRQTNNHGAAKPSDPHGNYR